jgi:carbamoyl-phosphate synthase small subunit
MRGFVVLEDGTVFRGRSVGAEGVAFGEAVFTTAMTGYQEVVTDPSYAEQMVCFTAPMVGNYGVDPDRSQSSRAHARAVLMREARGPEWTDWLRQNGLVGMSEIDTRSLVLHLRQAGAMRAAAVGSEASVDAVLEQVRAQPRMAGRSLAAEVSARHASRSSTTGASDRFSTGWRGRGQRSPFFRTMPTRTSSPATTASCSRTARAIRSRSATR